MSVWRNFLSAILPWVFKKGEAAAVAAVNKQDVGKATAITEADLAEVAAAAAPVVEATIKKATKAPK
jgi:hypothetical protein